jgi:uncharacterized protein (DUF983 family)
MQPRLPSILKQRCPRCREGRVFASLLRMNRQCPRCDLQFEREPGYFLGAMYFSYGLGVAAAVPLVLGLLFWTSMPLTQIGWLAGLELLLLSPALFRYSRVIWLHFDQTFDPI